VKLIKSIALFSLLAAVLGAQTTPSPQVRFKTNIGDIDVTLFPDSAPLTVANFLNYVNKGAYTSSIIHRSVPGFIIQGGGFQLVGGSPAPIASDAAVTNEYKISNTRGTIAMAKLDGNPNSATNQWFFNLVDNASNLDNANGGFTVFGKISNPNGLTTMDAIAKLPIQNLGAPLDTVPYSGTSYVTVNTISLRPPPRPFRMPPASHPPTWASLRDS
jgi:peptidyl-prolyl cis-trans isomerase A (cyclophilin A)